MERQTNIWPCWWVWKIKKINLLYLCQSFCCGSLLSPFYNLHVASVYLTPGIILIVTLGSFFSRYLLTLHLYCILLHFLKLFNQQNLSSKSKSHQCLINQITHVYKKNPTIVYLFLWADVLMPMVVDLGGK